MLNFVWDTLKGVATLATGVLFLFEGITFGVVPFDECVEQYNKNPRLFILGFARGFSFALLSYFIIVMIISMINGYFDVFIIVFGVVGVAASMAVCACISQHYDVWAFPLAISGLPLIIKLCHTSYYAINVAAKGKDGNDSRYSFLLTSLVFECLFLLCWSLWPFLSLRSQEQNIPLTVWALEFSDIISHLVVCLVYGASVSPIDDWSERPLLQTYFAFWVLNLFLWALPLYPMIILIIDGVMKGEKVISHKALGKHIFVIDLLTDVPFLIATLVGRSYVNNTYIAFDIAVKCLLLCRGMIWVPIVVFGDRFNPQIFGDWGFTVKEAKGKDAKVRFRSKSF